MTSQTTLRVARPTDRLDAVVRFYTTGLGFQIIGHFEGHGGYDGVMLGIVGAPYHLEFTRISGDDVRRAPTEDNLLDFYLSERAEWQRVVDWMWVAAHSPLASFNPQCDRLGVAFEDRDG